MKKAMTNMAIVGMVAMLLIIIIVMMLPKELLFKAGGEAAITAGCGASLKQHAYSESDLWIMGKRLVDKEKMDAKIDCPTIEKTIKSSSDKDIAGEFVTLMENTHLQYREYAGAFHLSKGSICIAHYLVDVAEGRVDSIPLILQKKNQQLEKEGKDPIAGFSPPRYANLNTREKVAVMAVFGGPFIKGFGFRNNFGVLLWDSKNYGELPCAVLAGDPLAVIKSYG